MLKRLLVTLLFIALLSCSDQPFMEWGQQSLTEAELDSCQMDPCPQMTINYVLAKGNSKVSDSINSHVEMRMIAVLANAEDGPQTVEQAMAHFAQRYQELLSDFPESAGADNYEVQLEVTLHGQFKYMVSLEVWAYMYEGGAHGWSGSDFLNFDLQTGAHLGMADLFTDQKALLEIAEQAFRLQRGLPDTGSLNEQGGFWFEQDRFRLPESVGIGPESLLFIYNQYDIASYAEGPIEFSIPLERIEHLINPELL